MVKTCHGLQIIHVLEHISLRWRSRAWRWSSPAGRTAPATRGARVPWRPADDELWCSRGGREHARSKHRRLRAVQRRMAGRPGASMRWPGGLARPLGRALGDAPGTALAAPRWWKGLRVRAARLGCLRCWQRLSRMGPSKISKS